MAPSPKPTCFPAGISTDQPYGPLAQYGAPHPFLYHTFADDFDFSIPEGAYTKTVTSSGSIALAANDGGTAFYTTNTSTPLATDIASLQLTTASFSLTAGKKLFFLARFQCSDMINAAWNIGLIQTTTTPMTVTDGIWFNKATGSNANLTFNAAVSSTIYTVTVPTANYTLANSTYIDLAFFVDRNQVLNGYVGYPLAGYLPQSGSVGVVPPQSSPAASLTIAGGVYSTVNNWIATTATLNPTVVLQSGTASSKTGLLDFLMVAKER